MLLVFGECELDLERRELHRDGAAVHVRAKVFDVLAYLILNRDKVVSRDDLLSHGWPGLTVSDATLSGCIFSVRKAIGDDVGDPRFIKTLRGQGFRFIGDVTGEGAIGAAMNDAARTAPAHARDDGLSVAVLPFANLNDDTKLNYLADGLSEDITSQLSRFKALTVIARNSSFQYRGPAIDIKKIGLELAVDYILEGSVRCRDEAFRVTAQLIHAPTTKHIWSESYDGPIGDIFALQDQIAESIAVVIKPEIDMAEISRAGQTVAGSLRGQEMAWRARALLDRSRAEAEPALYADGMKLAEQAAALDPHCRQAWWTIALANFLLAFARKVADPEAVLRRAREAAEKMRTLDRNDHNAYMSLGWINYIERDFAAAVRNLDQAHALNPNCTMTLMMMGVIAIASGEAKNGTRHIRRAMRLSPRDLWLGFMLAAQGFACFALDQFDEGIEFMRRAIEREPNAPANHVILAACLAENGELAAAAAAIRSQRRISENYLNEYLDGMRLPFQDPKLSARYAAALRRAAEAADRGMDS